MNVTQERSWMYNRQKNRKFGLRFMKGWKSFWILLVKIA